MRLGGIMTDEQALVKKIVTSLGEDADNEESIINEVEKISKSNKEDSKCIYRDLLKIFTHLDFDTGEAKVHWLNIFNHKVALAKKLRRAVPLRVAMLDYFIKVNRKLRNPKIIELEIFENMANSMIIDELTKVYNRRFFNDTIVREIERVKRYNMPLSLLMLDLDDFKKFNDTYGHLCGDRILMRVGALLKENCRNVDFPSRYGGEEFMVILPQTMAAGALRLGERIRERLGHVRFRTREGQPIFPVTISGGISTYGFEGTTAEDLINKADIALYHAKTDGKNRIYTYFVEKRKFLRINAGVVIVYRILKKGEFEKSLTKNIGGGGILFVADELIAIGTMLDLTIQIPDVPHTINAVGKVVRVEAIPDKKFEIGLFFSKINQADQSIIMTYVNELKVRQS